MHGHRHQPEVGVFPRPGVSLGPDSAASSRTGASGARAPPPGQGRGLGDAGTQPGWAPSSVLPSGLVEGEFGVNTQGTRGLCRGRGFTGRPRVTGPGSRLRSSAPRAGSPGPAAGPRSAAWRSRGRRRTGCAGRPRSPRRSARSQRLQAPEATTVRAALALGPRPSVEPRAGVGLQQSARLVLSCRLETSAFSSTACIQGDPRAPISAAPWSPGGGAHRKGSRQGQQRAVERGGGASGTHMEAKCLHPSAGAWAWTWVDLTRTGGQGLLGGPAGSPRGRGAWRSRATHPASAGCGRSLSPGRSCCCRWGRGALQQTGSGSAARPAPPRRPQQARARLEVTPTPVI